VRERERVRVRAREMSERERDGARERECASEMGVGREGGVQGRESESEEITELVQQQTPVARF